MKIIIKILKWAGIIFIVWLVLTFFSFNIVVKNEILDQSIESTIYEDLYDKLYNTLNEDTHTLRETISDSKKEVKETWDKMKK